MLSKNYGKEPQNSISSDRPAMENNNEETLKLSWVFAVLQRRALVMAVVTIVMSLIGSVLIIKSVRNIPKIYQGTFQILVEPVTSDAKFAQLYKQAGAGENTRISDYMLDVDRSSVDYQTQIRVLKSPRLMEPVVKKLKVKYPDITYTELVEMLEIKRISYEVDAKQQGTKILSISYQALDPRRVKFVLDTVAKAYLDYSLEQRQVGLRQGIDFIEKQLPGLRLRVNILSSQLRQLQEQYKLIDPDKKSDLLFWKLSGIQDAKRKNEADLLDTRSTYQALNRQFQKGNYSVILSRQPEGYRFLLSKLQEMETQIALESSRLQEDSLPMQSMLDKQKNIRDIAREESASILAQVREQLMVLEKRDAAMALEEVVLNQQIKSIPEFSQKFNKVQQELKIASDTLNQFLSKRDNLTIDTAQQVVPWELLSPPKNPKTAPPTSPKKNIMVLIILSSLFGLGVGFFLEVIQTVFHTPDEIRSATRLPVLGVIPVAKALLLAGQSKLENLISGSSGLSLGQTRSSTGGKGQLPLDFPFLEAFRSLYTNIYLLSADRPIRSLVIGSATDGDGKSTVSIYLAKTAAAVGQRVLLVDADLRIPQLHQQLGIPNVKGLSDALTTDLSLNDAIQRSPVDDNLFVLTAGHTPPDPIKLLSSKKMRYLMEQFQAFFDLVIYDIPPLVGLADGHLVAANTDGTVLVVRLERTDRAIVKKALDELSLSGASVLGIAANGAKESQLSSTRNQSIPMPTTTSVRSL